MTIHRRALRTGIAASVAAFALLAAAGCTAAPSTGGGDEGGDGDTFTVGVIDLFATAFYDDFDSGLQERADELGIKVTIANSTADPAKEAELVAQMVTAGVDALIISAVSPGSSTIAVRQAYDAGIPVICANTCLTDEDTEKYTEAFVTSNQEELGSSTAKALVEYVNANLGGSAKIALLTCETLDVCVQRRAGIDKELAAIDYEIVASQEAWEADKAVPIVESIFTANPDIDILLTENEGGLEGGVPVIAARQLDKPVKAFGIDMTPSIASMLLDPNDIMQTTTGQAPAEMGALAIQAAYDVLNGKTVEKMQFSASLKFTRSDPAAIEAWLNR